MEGDAIIMRIYHQSVFERWSLEDGSVQAICTSPPYWGLRKYQIPDVVIGGKEDCEHNFQEEKFKQHSGRGDCQKSGKFSEQSLQSFIPDMILFRASCTKCSAWKGQYGLEPDFKMYIAHTLLWCREAWRVLKDDGIFFLNLGDSYNGSGGAGGDYNDGGLRAGQPRYKQGSKNGLPNKCLLDIPARVSIALVDEQGWVKRNNIVWYKPNSMPESCRDRFSKKHEMIFFFTKNPQYYSGLDSIREPHKKSSIERLGRGVSENNKWVYGPDGQTPEQREWNLKGKNPGDVWKIPTSASSEKHYAMWPEALVKRMILFSSKPGDTVLDPFCGSGTTLKVAEELGREGKGIDLGYKEIQGRRLSGIQKELGMR